jgi:hypothetical protein
MTPPNPGPAFAHLTDLGPQPPAYCQLQAHLARTSWICQGTLVCRPLLRRVRGRKVKRGPYYLWTSKVKGKTVCLALSQAQYQLLRQAIQNNQRLHKLLERMQALTLKTIVKKVPGVRKRK